MKRGKHVTIPAGVTRAVRWIEAQPDVERMVFGQYKPRKRAKGEVDVVGPCTGGLKVLAAWRGPGDGDVPAHPHPR